MEYQVPQFIEVEDKIFGPLTIKQFIYISGGAGLIAIVVATFGLFMGVVLGLPIAALALALAFYKVNGKPFIQILESGFNFITGRRRYLWRKEREPLTPSVVASAPAAPAAPSVPAMPPKAALTRRKLEELAWSLDVKDTGQEPR